MAQQIIKLPFFQIRNSSIYYLGCHEYLSLKNSCLQPSFRNKILFDEGIMIQKRPIRKGKSVFENILVIEPHPDDFALSASGYVLDALHRGANVTVLNLFSKTPKETFPWRANVDISEAQYERLRLEESKIAIEQYLGEKFESFRLSSPNLGENSPTFVKLHCENEMVSDLTHRLAEKINKERIDTVLCPMAIQGHIAHLVAFDATIETFRLLKRNIRLILYEDMPYARNKEAYFRRLKQLMKEFTVKRFYISTEQYLEIMADLIVMYRSQFDDINRKQLLAIIKEDFRATASGLELSKKKIEFAQSYFEIKGLK